ncbi:DNA methyltransferase [Aerococcus viridans]|uniref:DNA methyltransferase n=1 Tax=Aerococcus viridans TaxID=1377 RepID=UPI00031F653F|nr:DNA methyltransferase [Aerococcus viridans]
MDQGSLFEEENKPVECLGITFENDNERREYFRNELRKKLPDLKKIEGFPIGEDEDIIALSDPPYYTACPNPWTIIKEDSLSKDYKRHPYVSDVSIGKNDPIYTAHSYHTKVPYKAIMKYILHYTDPGDIVLDAFSGTGMTGVASSMCGNKELVEELGIEEGQFGIRNSILSDLSPVASFISYCYNSPVNVKKLQFCMEKIINESREKYNWLYQTGQEIKYEINYVIWSDVFLCPECNTELIFYESAVKGNKVEPNFTCQNCTAKLTKQKMNRAYESSLDILTGEKVRLAKQVPVAVNYIDGKQKILKEIEDNDIKLIQRIEEIPFESWIPIEKIPEGVNTKQPFSSHGFSYVHQFYTKRNLLILSDLSERINNLDEDIKKHAYLCLQSIIYSLTSKLVRYNLGNRGNGVLNGTMYVPSLVAETNVYKVLSGKIKDIIKALIVSDRNTMIGISSATYSNLKENSIDYIFTDPPFGANINYSELNFIWEAWLGIKTNNKDEAIVNTIQNKELLDYKGLMEESFKNYYKILKQNHWITVEFSNSKASIWNAIQDSMQKAGFIIANVSALDKQQGSFKAVTTTTAVKQDLVISAYKPLETTVLKIKQANGDESSAWLFLDQHLLKLPEFDGNRGEANIISERTPRILFDRMVAYHVQSGISVPLSSAEFQEKVAQKYVMRDGMVFLESQVAKYDKKRILAKEFSQQSLFVSDESSAIEWLRQQLMKKPQSRQDIHPQFMKEIQYIAKHEELPELDNLLAENFLLYDSEDVVPDQIAAYLRKNYHDMRGLENQDDKLKSKAKNRWYVPDPNKQADLEKLREKSLLREFNHYVEEVSGTKKKLKLFRSEAIRAGFKKAWGEKDYQKIVDVAEYLPEKIIQEDDKLLMFHTHALMRLDI